ncbi:hypothetical protein EYF80_051032 [Liparis tanakae]|uniref:Uncharacterized protein n=1 Tax=Liparis tanakae TaxID=230148 RepID=A0A4Z2FC30_9TELE|nr:hypothetical protein EYF80_051032 [Liparis tanakae]
MKLTAEWRKKEKKQKESSEQTEVWLLGEEKKSGEPSAAFAGTRISSGYKKRLHGASFTGMLCFPEVTRIEALKLLCDRNVTVIHRRHRAGVTPPHSLREGPLQNTVAAGLIFQFTLPVADCISAAPHSPVVVVVVIFNMEKLSFPTNLNPPGFCGTNSVDKGIEKRLSLQENQNKHNCSRRQVEGTSRRKCIFNYCEATADESRAVAPRDLSGPSEIVVSSCCPHVVCWSGKSTSDEVPKDHRPAAHHSALPEDSGTGAVKQTELHCKSVQANNQAASDGTEEPIAAHQRMSLPQSARWSVLPVHHHRFISMLCHVDFSLSHVMAHFFRVKLSEMVLELSQRGVPDLLWRQQGEGNGKERSFSWLRELEANLTAARDALRADEGFSSKGRPMLIWG